MNIILYITFLRQMDIFDNSTPKKTLLTMLRIEHGQTVSYEVACDKIKKYKLQIKQIIEVSDPETMEQNSIELYTALAALKAKYQ